MDALEIEAGLLGLEEYLGCSESLAAYQDLATVWQLVVFLASVTLLRVLLRSLVIVDDEAHFLLDVLHNFDFCIGSEAITSVVQDFLKIGCDVATGQVDPLDCVRDCIAFVYWHGV